VAIEAHYRFLAWLVEKFPKIHKFTIGDRTENIALDVLEALIKPNFILIWVSRRAPVAPGGESLDQFCRSMRNGFVRFL
jgi:hypothetical protein